MLIIEHLKYFVQIRNVNLIKGAIPVYIIDDDIYSKIPTIIIGTVDKFARITFEERVHLVFGRRNIECSECGNFYQRDHELIEECTNKNIN